MSSTTKHCLICEEPFHPDPRTARHQKVCSQETCRKERRARNTKRWRTLHPGYDARPARRAKVRAWAKSVDYWRRWRAGHADYRLRERSRLKSGRLGAKRVAKQIVIRKISLGKLAQIRLLAEKTVAKQTVMPPWAAGLLDFLVWKESVAKQTDMALSGPQGA